jgi:hypothetical protein
VFLVSHSKDVFKDSKFDFESFLEFANNIDVQLGQLIARVCRRGRCVCPRKSLTWRATNYADLRTFPQSLSNGG